MLPDILKKKKRYYKCFNALVKSFMIFYNKKFFTKLHALHVISTNGAISKALYTRFLKYRKRSTRYIIKRIKELKALYKPVQFLMTK